MLSDGEASRLSRSRSSLFAIGGVSGGWLSECLRRLLTEGDGDWLSLLVLDAGLMLCWLRFRLLEFLELFFLVSSNLSDTSLSDLDPSSEPLAELELLLLPDEDALEEDRDDDPEELELLLRLERLLDTTFDGLDDSTFLLCAFGG